MADNPSLLNCGIGVGNLKQWHAWLRPFAARFFVPELEHIWAHRRTVNEILVPVIRERKEAMKVGDEGPDDLLQWMIRKAPAYSMTDQDLAQMQLTISMAAIHTTTLSIADILSELAIRPDLVAELRAEIVRVLQKGSGGKSLQPSTHDLYQMKLLDSVMRESQRVNPVAQRKSLPKLTVPHAKSRD